MRQMAKKPVTKIDPRKELSPYLNHEFNQQKNSRKSKAKISASLSSLQAERRRSLRRRLGLIMTISILAIAALGYYISPLANISTVKVVGTTDLPVKEIVKISKIKASDKVFDYLFQQKDLSQKLSRKYPEIQRAQLHLGHVNQLILQINERKTLGYLKDGDSYRKILDNGIVENVSIIPMKLEKQDEETRKYYYVAKIELTTGGNYGYTFRVMPKHEMILEPTNLNLVKWITK